MDLRGCPADRGERHAVIEAFAAGKPVVASKIGGIPELVRDRQDGLLFEPGNVADLADRIHALMADAGLRRQLGESARKKIEALYRPQSHYADLMEILARAAL